MVNRDKCAVIWRTSIDGHRIEIWRNMVDVEEYEEHYDSDTGKMIMRKLIRPDYDWHVVDEYSELVTGELLKKVQNQYWDIVDRRIQKFYEENPNVVFGVPDEVYFID